MRFNGQSRDARWDEEMGVEFSGIAGCFGTVILRRWDVNTLPRNRRRMFAILMTTYRLHDGMVHGSQHSSDGRSFPCSMETAQTDYDLHNF